MVILSKYPLSNVQSKRLRYTNQVVSCGGSSMTVAARTILGAQVSINSHPLALFSVRTNYADLKCVTQEEIRMLKSWAQTTYPGLTHLYGGDFNTGAGESPYWSMVNEAQTSVDSWYEAVLDGTAVSYNGSPSFSTGTKTGRLDYVFTQSGPTVLDLRSAQIYAKTAYSDHRPIMSVFDVR
jgi:endonuclease/exonuclease/phosphatase family metal-dependent hydrolase